MRSDRPRAPAWCRLVRQYLAGDVRAGWQSRNSVRRWNRRIFTRGKQQ